MNSLPMISCFLILALFNAVNGVVHRDCGSKTGKILAFEAFGCYQRHRCDLRPGQNQTIEIKFAALQNSHTLQVRAFGIIGGRTHEFQMKNRDVCRYDINCPMQKGNEYIYQTTIYIDPKFPRVSMVVKWELQDDNHDDVICIMVPAKIV